VESDKAHLSIETMARWLAGDLDHEEVLREILPHLLDRCEQCQGLHAEILDLQREFDHWDEKVAVLEGREAPELLASLVALSVEEQLALIESDDRFQTWGLCQLLLRRSLEAVLEDPSRAVILAEMAVLVAEALVKEAYDPHWVLDLQAKSYAYLGNARRVLGELWSAEAAFRRAESHLGASLTGNARVIGEILDLEASLRRAQRRFDEALGLLDRAVALFRETGDLHLVSQSLLKKAKTLEEIGDLDGAIRLLKEATSLIDPAREPRLILCARHNLVWTLSAAGRNRDAEALLPELRRLSRELGNPLDLTRLRWAEGRVAWGLGQRGPAETAFREVQREFLERRMGYDAALVSLDLAALYAEEGCTEDLKRLANEIMPVFESREVQREAMAALLLFQHACEEERLTADLAREIAAILRRERGARC
jgi:tetratricopeptide (TPR) repeat protein